VAAALPPIAPPPPFDTPDDKFFYFTGAVNFLLLSFRFVNYFIASHDDCLFVG
jgi:hypothetical protein